VYMDFHLQKLATIEAWCISRGAKEFSRYRNSICKKRWGFEYINLDTGLLANAVRKGRSQIMALTVLYSKQVLTEFI